MKKFCALISKFSPSNGISFFPIFFLVLEELEDVVCVREEIIRILV
jgi:hypothetical protein